MSVKALKRFVHATAVVEPGAQLGPGCKVWHFAHVMAGARVGARATLGQNVFVGSTAVVGAGCKVANNVSIYDSVHLEDDVFIGPSAVFTNVKTPRAFISRKDAYASTRVGRGASVGANATIVCGCRIGEYALIGAGAVVTRDVPAFALVTGVPARQRGWVCTCGTTLPPFSKGRVQATTCPACARVFLRAGDTLRVADASAGRRTAGTPPGKAKPARGTTPVRHS